MFETLFTYSRVLPSPRRPPGRAPPRSFALCSDHGSTALVKHRSSSTSTAARSLAIGIHGLVVRIANKAAETVPSLRDKRVSPHTVRHATAVHALVSISTIRAWLGHSPETQSLRRWIWR